MMAQNCEATRLFNWLDSRRGQPLLCVDGIFAVFLTSFVCSFNQLRREGSSNSLASDLQFV